MYIMLRTTPLARFYLLKDVLHIYQSLSIYVQWRLLLWLYYSSGFHQDLHETHMHHGFLAPILISEKRIDNARSDPPYPLLAIRNMCTTPSEECSLTEQF